MKTYHEFNRKLGQIDGKRKLSTRSIIKLPLLSVFVWRFQGSLKKKLLMLASAAEKELEINVPGEVSIKSPGAYQMRQMSTVKTSKQISKSWQET